MEKVLLAVGVIFGMVIIMGIVGSLSGFKIIEVTKKTKADKSIIWQLWTDVPNRTVWDGSLEWATIDGSFQLGMTGELKLKEQPVRRYEIIECEQYIKYTDRYFLPAGGKMDWRHTIKALENNENEITFLVKVSGPTSFLLFPILSIILKEELPRTVEKLIEVAETM